MLLRHGLFFFFAVFSPLIIYAVLGLAALLASRLLLPRSQQPPLLPTVSLGLCALCMLTVSLKLGRMAPSLRWPAALAPMVALLALHMLVHIDALCRKARAKGPVIALWAHARAFVQLGLGACSVLPAV